MPTPNDTKDQLAAKSDLRGKIMFTRLALGETYGNKDYAVSLNRGLATILNPSIEKELDPRLDDIINAYAIGKTNRPMNQAFAIDPGTKNGEVVYSALDDIVGRVRNGSKVRDAVADVSQNLQFKTDKFDPNNMWDYTTVFDGSKKDGEKFSLLSRDLAIDLGITSGDSSVYFARELRARVTANLRTTLNADAAFEAAQAEMSDPSNYFVVNGAILPAKAFKGDITPKVLEFWLDTKYKDKNAKLVVIGERSSGEPMFGVRDGRDNHFMDQIVSPSDVRIDTPEMVQAFVAWMEEDKKKRGYRTDMPGVLKSLTSTPFGGAY